MKAVIQRVQNANVSVNNQTVGSIDHGLLLFLGIEHTDSHEEVDIMLKKVINLRIFNDPLGKMNLSLLDTKGGLLVISQFTLMADLRKGNRPSFTHAAPSDKAEVLYNLFCEKASQQLPSIVQKGIFGADMKVELVNDGPVTILLEVPTM